MSSEDDCLDAGDVDDVRDADRQIPGKIIDYLVGFWVAATGQLKYLGDILDAQAKADWLNHIRAEFNLHPEQVIAMGDGANDLKMMAQAGTSIAYHAKPIVRTQAGYAFNFVGLNGLVNLFA